MNECMYGYIYIYIYACMCVYIYIYIYICMYGVPQFRNFGSVDLVGLSRIHVQGQPYIMSNIGARDD